MRLAKVDTFSQLPEAASTLAKGHDVLYYSIYWLSVVLFVAIMATMLYFVVRFRRKSDRERTGHTIENTKLEIAWTILPLIPMFFMFHYGFKAYMDGAVAPVDAMEVRVLARQWSWEFVYPDGTASPGVLAVPVNKPVKLVLSSEDVIHSFYVPEFRVKRDVVPGMYSTLWFEATKEGEYTAFCTEYCGAPPNQSESGHFGMLATVKVMPEAAFTKWLEEAGGPPAGQSPEQWGESLYTQYACVTCHSNKADEMKQAPNFWGVWGRKEKLEDGSSIVVDENYVRESILEPNAKRVAGFGGIVMPPYALNDAQIDAIVAYLKSLK
ncbi:MAG: cytochrome c oxidase subunit II [Myxococcales bacterium]|nr:MAG: cytochrome c oxidase subunit II [Myxococcales bacterium]